MKKIRKPTTTVTEFPQFPNTKKINRVKEKHEPLAELIPHPVPCFFS